MKWRVYWTSLRSIFLQPEKQRKQLWRIWECYNQFPGGSDIKESACDVEICIRSLGQDNPLEKGMATHSSILSWRIPQIEQRIPFLQSMGSRRVGHKWATNIQKSKVSFTFWMWYNLPFAQTEFFKVLFPYLLFLAVVGCCTGFSPVVMHRLLMVMTSLVAEHWL